MSTEVERIVEALAKLAGLSPDDLQRQVIRDRMKRAEAERRNNNRFYATLDLMTPEQKKFVEACEADGAKINKVYPSRDGKRCAVMLTKHPVWRPATGRMGRKLIMAYPTLPNAETFEKTITIRSF